MAGESQGEGVPEGTVEKGAAWAREIWGDAEQADARNVAAAGESSNARFAGGVLIRCTSGALMSKSVSNRQLRGAAAIGNGEGRVARLDRMNEWWRGRGFLTKQKEHMDCGRTTDRRGSRGSSVRF